MSQTAAAATQEVERVAGEIISWEGRREVLETAKAAAYAVLLDCREAELEGRPDPDGLAAARMEVADLDEQLSACSRRILDLHEHLAVAAANEIAIRHETAPQRLEALEEQRRQAFPAMAQALAQAIVLRDCYWPPGKDSPFDFSKLSLPGVDQEIEKLKSETSGVDFLAALQGCVDDLQRSPESLRAINYVNGRCKSILKGLRQGGAK